MSDTTAQDYGLRSNETNVFYLNIDAAVDADDQAYATTFTKGTLSHEFQHMCNAHYFDFGDGQYKERTMDSWANEMCSTTTESIFADQYSVYVPVLNADVGTKKSFSQGKTDFLHWDNDFTQYTTAALLGGYILSQLPEANRPAFIRTFLDNTFLEDPTPAQYIEDQAETTYRSSVEDLILALQDSAVGFSTLYGTDWTTVSVNDTDNSGFAKDWAIVMKGFVSALTGKNADYNQYLKDVTSAENKAYVPAPSIPLAAAATTTVALKASAFVVGKTKVASTASVSLGDASTTGTDAYVIVWNGLIPALPNPWSSEDETYTLPTGTANLTGVLLKPETSAPESRGFIGYGFRFDRTNSRPAGSVSVATFRVGASSPAAARTTDIAGVGDSSNPAITGGGNLACVYLAY